MTKTNRGICGEKGFVTKMVMFTSLDGMKRLLLRELGNVRKDEWVRGELQAIFCCLCLPRYVHQLAVSAVNEDDTMTMKIKQTWRYSGEHMSNWSKKKCEGRDEKGMEVLGREGGVGASRTWRYLLVVIFVVIIVIVTSMRTSCISTL